MFNLDNPFWNTVSKLCDLVILNLLFVACCIPVITIGSSITALYVVMRKKIRNEGSSVVKEFFKAFKDNFKQATIIWLILLPLGLLTIYEMYLMTWVELSSLAIIKYVFFSFLIVWILIVSYVFPVAGRFDNSIIGTFKNALLMSIYHLFPWSILIVGVNLLPWFLIFSASGLKLIYIQVMCWIGFTIGAGINSFIFEKIFQKYIDAKEESN